VPMSARRRHHPFRGGAVVAEGWGRSLRLQPAAHESQACDDAAVRPKHAAWYSGPDHTGHWRRPEPTPLRDAGGHGPLPQGDGTRRDRQCAARTAWSTGTPKPPTSPCESSSGAGHKKGGVSSAVSRSWGLLISLGLGAGNALHPGARQAAHLKVCRSHRPAIGKHCGVIATNASAFSKAARSRGEGNRASIHAQHLPPLRPRGAASRETSLFWANSAAARGRFGL
jgi:hypothetical protein